MAQSEEMLRKIYDRRRPKQKRRPIEEAMQEVLAEYVADRLPICYSYPIQSMLA